MREKLKDIVYEKFKTKGKCHQKGGGAPGNGKGQDLTWYE